MKYKKNEYYCSMASTFLSAEHQDSIVRPIGRLHKIFSPIGISFYLKYRKTLVHTDQLVSVEDPWAPTTYEYLREDGWKFRCKQRAVHGMVEWTDFENKMPKE